MKEALVLLTLLGVCFYTAKPYSQPDPSLQYAMIFSSAVGLNGIDKKPMMTHTVEQEYPVVDGGIQYPWGAGLFDAQSTIPVIPVCDIAVIEEPVISEEPPPMTEFIEQVAESVPVIDDIIEPEPEQVNVIKPDQICVNGKCFPRVRYYKQPIIFFKRR